MISNQIVETKYESSPAALSSGGTRQLPGNQLGQTLTDLGTRLAGEDIANDNIKTRYTGSRTYISTATTTIIKSGAGHIHTIVIGETSAGAITVYDNTSGTGDIIKVLKASIAEGTYLLDAPFGTGLTIVTAGASKLMISWS